MLDVHGLALRRGSFVLHELSLSVAPGRTLALLGPNGAGKSTLLEAVAGLLPVDRGRIAVGGVDCTALAAEHRHVGYLVQDYALFPHLSVRGNVRFGMPRRRRSGSYEDGVLERLGLRALADRRPAQLSGGEKQRVALARALAAEARVLLLDEPLAALDPTIRPALQRELRALLRELDVAALFVTHDLSEARAVADDVAVLRAGRLVQHGALEHVLAHPADAFVAELVGVENRWPGRVTHAGGGLLTVQLDGAPLSVRARGEARPGAAVLVCLRGEDVELTCAQAPAGNAWPLRALRARSASGPFATFEADCGVPVTVHASKREAAGVLAAPLQRVRAAFTVDAVHLAGIDDIPAG